jgi:hypothetical protein
VGAGTNGSDTPSDLPAELTQLVQVLKELSEGRDVPLDGDVARLMEKVADAIDGAPWDLPGRGVLGTLYLARARRTAQQGLAAGEAATAGKPDGDGDGEQRDPDLLTGVELLRPVAEAHPDLVDPLVRGVYAGTHHIVGNRIDEVLTTWNHRLGDLLPLLSAGDTSRLAAAREAFEHVRDGTSPDHPDRAAHLVNMSSFHRILHHSTEDSSARDEATRLARLAVAAADGSDLYPMSLALLAACLGDDASEEGGRYEEAIAVHRAALAALPAGSAYVERLRMMPPFSATGATTPI